MSWRLPEGEAKLASAGRRIRRRRMSPEHANLSEAEGQNCRKDRRRRQRKPEGLKSEHAYPEGSCPAKRGKPAGVALKGRRPSLPCRRPRRQMSERQASGAVKPSDSEAERRIHHQRSPPQRAVH